MKWLFNLCLIVVSVILTTISCSSRRMEKSKIEESSAVKEREVVKVDSTSSSNKTIGTINTNTTDKYAYNDDLLIEYEPTFDANGILIPFRYTKTENGKTIDVNITGTGKVKSSTKQATEKIYIKEENIYQEQIDALVKSNKEQQLVIEKLLKKETKDAVSAPDYVKYFIWILIGFGLLAAIIIGLVIYFKATIGKYKNILKTLTNDS